VYITAGAEPSSGVSVSWTTPRFTNKMPGGLSGKSQK
jgi:hypothetical protein